MDYDNEKSKKPIVQQLQYWSFTWNASTTKDMQGLPDRLMLAKFLNERGWKWVFQHERVSRDHYQGRLNLMSKKCKNPILGLFEAGGFDITNLTIRPESNNSLKVDGLEFYCMKVDRIDGPWGDPSWSPPKIKKIYDGKDVKCMEKPLKWQEKPLQWMTEEPDDRWLLWFYNKSGNVGKTKLQKWLCWKKLAKRVCMGTATQIKTAVAEAGEHSLYVCNIPKVSGTQESQRDLFSALEDIKDGWVESVMYGKEHELMMDHPHVWIFSNELPNLAYASPDRWKVFEITDKDSDLKLLSNNELVNIRNTNFSDFFESTETQAEHPKILKNRVVKEVKITKNKPKLIFEDV